MGIINVELCFVSVALKFAFSSNSFLKAAEQYLIVRFRSKTLLCRKERAKILSPVGAFRQVVLLLVCWRSDSLTLNFTNSTAGHTDGIMFSGSGFSIVSDVGATSPPSGRLPLNGNGRLSAL